MNLNKKYRAELNSSMSGQFRIVRIRIINLGREILKACKEVFELIVLVLVMCLFLFGCSNNKIISAACFDSVQTAAEYNAKKAGWDSVAVVDTLYLIEKRELKNAVE